MIPFERIPADRSPARTDDAAPASLIRADLSRVERDLLATLSAQLLDVLFDADDPVAARLLPDPYPDDPAASAEFQRLTGRDLTQRKATGARGVLADVSGDDGLIELDEAQANQWLRTLTDLRLTIANRLGIETDDDEGRTDAAARPLRATYYWLGGLQEALVATLDEDIG